jgi:acetyl esterase/lipase
MQKLLWLAAAMLLHACTADTPSPRTEVRTNVVYGMVSGTSLLLDVLVPATSNHTALIAIPGSGWGSGYPTGYDQPSLKDDHFLDTAYFGKWCHALADRGYTVFVIDHRFSPKYRCTDIIADARRAVRYVRQHAKEYDVRAERIGAIGHSSGGNLAALLATTDTTITAPASEVDRCSSRVQAVVTLAAPFDLWAVQDLPVAENRAFMEQVLTDYIGVSPTADTTDLGVRAKYALASPIAHVTSDDAPMLLFAADDDPIIPPAQAVAMELALVRQQVPVQRIVAPGGHTPAVDLDAVDAWYEQYLR